MTLLEKIEKLICDSCARYDQATNSEGTCPTTCYRKRKMTECILRLIKFQEFLLDEVGQHPDYESRTATICPECFGRAFGLLATVKGG